MFVAHQQMPSMAICAIREMEKIIILSLACNMILTTINIFTSLMLMEVCYLKMGLRNDISEIVMVVSQK